MYRGGSLVMPLLLIMYRAVNSMQLNEKKRSPAMLRVRNVFFFDYVLCELLCYLTFATCYVKGYQQVKNVNGDVFICRSRNFTGYCRRLPTRWDWNVGFQHRADISVNEQIAWYVGVFFFLWLLPMCFTCIKRTCYPDTMYICMEMIEIMFIFFSFNLDVLIWVIVDEWKI